MMAKRISIAASTLRGRDYDYKSELISATAADVLPNVASGKYKVILDSEFPMTTEGVRDAHKRMGSFQNIGKIVINVRRDDE